MLAKNASFKLIVSGHIGVKEIDLLIRKLQLDKEIVAIRKKTWRSFIIFACATPRMTYTSLSRLRARLNLFLVLAGDRSRDRGGRSLGLLWTSMGDTIRNKKRPQLRQP